MKMKRLTCCLFFALGVYGSVWAQAPIVLPPGHEITTYMVLNKDLGLGTRHNHFDLPYCLPDSLAFYPYSFLLPHQRQGYVNSSLQSRWQYDTASDEGGHYTELWFWHQLNKPLTLFVSAAVTNNPDGEYLLGTHHTRLGHTGMINRAYVSGRWDHFELLWGRVPLQWGPGRLRQLGVQGNMPSQDLIKLTFKQAGRYRLSTFLSQLDRQSIDSDAGGTVLYNRWLAGHRLEIPLFEQKVLVGLGDYVLYTGQNRGIEINYFNPLSPFHTQTFENKVEGIDTAVDSTARGDNQNVAIYGDCNWAIQPNLHLYGELFVDEFQIDQADRDKMDDSIGLLLGVAGGRQSGRLTWHFMAEAYRLSTWLYNHGGIATNWVYNGHHLGFDEGADLRGFKVRNEWWLDSDKMLALDYTHFDQGEITTDSPWAPESTKGRGFPCGVVEKTRRVELSIFYYPLPWLLCEGGVAYQSINNKEHVTNVDQEKASCRFSFQVIL